MLTDKRHDPVKLFLPYVVGWLAFIVAVGHIETRPFHGSRVNL